MCNLINISKDRIPVDELDYRGYHILFYEDPFGKQIYTVWDNSPLSFGVDNTQYKEDMKLIINNFLDTIYEFKDFMGAKLAWFNNGNYKDIKLTYWNRTLKIFLVANEKQVTKNILAKLISDSKVILESLIEKDN